VIVDTLNNIKLYKALLPQLISVENFILTHQQEEDLECCKYIIDNENVFALVQKYLTKQSKETRWEAHGKYIDVQYILRGQEAIGYAPIEELTLLEDFSGDNDIAFYKGPEDYTKVVLSKGMFAIFYPGEGHLPCGISGTDNNVKKIVFKIKIN